MTACLRISTPGAVRPAARLSALAATFRRSPRTVPAARRWPRTRAPASTHQAGSRKQEHFAWSTGPTQAGPRGPRSCKTAAAAPVPLCRARFRPVILARSLLRTHHCYNKVYMPSEPNTTHAAGIPSPHPDRTTLPFTRTASSPPSSPRHSGPPSSSCPPAPAHPAA